MASEIVGRGEELAAIEALLDEERLPGALVLEGEAGIGKTTLWRAGVQEARQRGYRVLAARPASAELEMTFAGLGDLLGGCLGEVGVELPPPQRRALEAALLLVDPEGTPPLPNLIGTAVLTSLRSLSHDRPVLVAVDDVQWLDQPSTAALGYALRRLADEHVALLVGWRTDTDDAVPLGLGGVLDLEVRRLRVGPLSLGALHRLIADRLGHALPRPLLVRIYEASGGNPFYALELAHAIERRGVLPAGAELPLPVSLASALAERVHAVPGPTQGALMAVACLGTTPLETLEAALGAGARRRLQPAFDAGLLRLDDGVVSFTHPLARAAVYNDAWPSQRREWHARLAGVVSDPDDRARHLALSIDAPDAHVAGALADAANRARLRGAPEAAAALAELAWKATPEDEPELAWRRGLRAAEYHMQSGDVERFEEIGTELLPRARSGDERSEVYALLSLVRHRLEGAAASVRLLEQAFDEAETPEQRQSVLSDLVSLAVFTGDVERAAGYACESLALAEAIGDPATLADALALVAAVDQVLGRGLRRDLLERSDAIADLRETDRMAETTGVLRNLYNWAGILFAADEFDEARARFSEARRLIEAQRLVQHLPELHRGIADLECWAGDWEAALASVETCEEVADQTGQHSKRDDVRYARAFVAAHRGRVEEARAVNDAGLASAERDGNVRSLVRHLAVLGFLELSLGDAEAAVAALERASCAAEGGGFREPSRFRFHGDLAEALVAMGNLDAAGDVVDWLAKSGEVTGYPWTQAAAARCRALIRAEQHEIEAAIGSLETALEAHERLGNPFERARTLLVLGVVRRRGKQRLQSRAALTEALAIFEHVDAPLWAERTRRELSRIPGRRVSDRDELTQTEQRIAELVAEGRSNKEVAATLFVTVKTVEATLTRIYRKLGVRSRAELARHFVGAAKE